MIACSSSSFFDAACSGESEVTDTTNTIVAKLIFAQENVCRRIDLSDDPRIIACMVSFMYDLDYEDDFELCSGDVIVDEKRKDPPAMPLTTNARVWLVAEKYDVKGLKECAVQKTTKIFDTVRWWYKDLASAAELAWKQTESSENKLRNIYVENFLNQRSDIFDAHESKEMVAIFGSNPEFLWEVLRKDWEQQQESNKT